MNAYDVVTVIAATVTITAGLIVIVGGLTQRRGHDFR